MTSEEFPYRTATAFRTALRDRLTPWPAVGGHSLDDLQRRLAYDRLLARTFTAHDASHWVLKGAGALLARLPDARHSHDIDLAFTGASTHFEHGLADPLLNEAVASLHTALDADLGDFFRFEVTRTSPLPEASKGRRIHVVAYLGARYATFHVDIVVGTTMTGTPQPGPPLVPLHIPGLIRPDYRLFPLPDHIADKVCAILEIHHHRQGPQPSTRVKDLVDLALIATSQTLDADALSAAIRIGAAHRELHLPQRFAVSDNPLWRKGYPRRAREAPAPSKTSTPPNIWSQRSSTPSWTAPPAAPGTPHHALGLTAPASTTITAQTARTLDQDLRDPLGHVAHGCLHHCEPRRRPGGVSGARWGRW